MESTDDLEPDIEFSPVKKRRYDKYNSEVVCFVTKVKVDMSLRGELFKVYFV